MWDTLKYDFVAFLEGYTFYNIIGFVFVYVLARCLTIPRCNHGWRDVVPVSVGGADLPTVPKKIGIVTTLGAQIGRNTPKNC